MGRVLGIDHGDTRIGLALSDPLHLIASPFRTIAARNSTHVLLVLGEIIRDQAVDTIVVGLPLGMRNQETDQTRRTRQFARDIDVFDIPVILEDERLSSVSATKALVQQNIKTGHNKGLVDQTAAAIVLQQYLDRTAQ
ncbi:MAG: Holliday junction resolvase RuvX [Candidatus Neomarinimicrobiota bacterium]